MVRLVAGALLALALVGCGDPAEWVPRGEVAWVQWREGDSANGHYGQATYRLTNPGRASLAVADLAVRIVTERDEYFVQAQVKPDLPPGKAMFGTVEVLFRDPGDRGSLAGVTLESSAFH
jgi:hypothetical protein